MSTRHHTVILDADAMGDDFTWPDLSRFGTCDSYGNSTPDEVNERVKNATIILTNKVLVTGDTMNAAPHLQYIGTVATGYNQVDIEEATKRGIPVCNVPGYSTPTVAQHTFGLILSLASGIHLHANAVADGEWAKATQFCFWKTPGMELEGKTLGIVGFGNIGQAVAKLGHAFGMNVVVYAPRPKPAPDFTPFSFVDFPSLLKISDVVTLHCPLTPENQYCINKDSLQTMKKTSYLINCSRGALIHQQDLSDALKNGVIAGAGLDVVEVEPMPNDNPLRTTPNCVITPHMAWAPIECRTRLVDMALDNIQAFLDKKPTNVVNGVVVG